MDNGACLYYKLTYEPKLSGELENQSTESADGGGCLKFYRSLEMIVIDTEIQRTNAPNCLS